MRAQRPARIRSLHRIDAGNLTKALAGQRKLKGLMMLAKLEQAFPLKP